ncbi:MAG: hypothetical protein QMD06_02490 [Candidatus Altarchaeum sp.]|nr:hypothetical protein [Candidatus Altarchaeum sp.]
MADKIYRFVLNILPAAMNIKAAPIAGIILIPKITSHPHISIKAKIYLNIMTTSVNITPTAIATIVLSPKAISPIKIITNSIKEL